MALSFAAHPADPSILALTISGASYSESAHAAGEERFETADPFAISSLPAEVTAEGP